MSYRVRYRSLALGDVEQILAWREENVPSTVRGVEEDLSGAERTLCDAPLAFRRVHGQVRRIALRRFPYKLWYLVDDDRSIVRILACLHQYQDEERFFDRLE